MSKPVSEGELLDGHSQAVYNLALRLVGNPSDAEDLAQDALLRALKALPRFRGECALSTWIYRITVNTWKNRVRSEKRRGFWKLVPLDVFAKDTGDEAERPLSSDDPPLDAALESGERGTAVQEALKRLDEDSRAVIVLRELRGQSYEQIAAVLGVPEGTVKSRLWRAREALKRSLKDEVAP